MDHQKVRNRDDGLHQFLEGHQGDLGAGHLYPQASGTSSQSFRDRPSTLRLGRKDLCLHEQLRLGQMDLGRHLGQMDLGLHDQPPLLRRLRCLDLLNCLVYHYRQAVASTDEDQASLDHL